MSLNRKKSAASQTNTSTTAASTNTSIYPRSKAGMPSNVPQMSTVASGVAKGANGEPLSKAGMPSNIPQSSTATSGTTKASSVIDKAKDTFVSITDTAKGALSNSSPAPVVTSISTPSPKGTSLEKGVGAVVATGAKLVGGIALAAALVCVASGIAQDYARKKRYKAGSGSFWTFLATLPSFKHPRPFFYKIASFANGRYVGDENAGDIYKRFCLVPAVKQNSTVHLLDNWGGWLSLYLDKGDGSELVISHDKGNNTIRVVTDSLEVAEYELPPQAEVAALIYSKELV